MNIQLCWRWIYFNTVHNSLAGFHTHFGDSFFYNCALNLTSQVGARWLDPWFPHPWWGGRAKMSLGMPEEDGFDENWFPMCQTAWDVRCVLCESLPGSSLHTGVRVGRMKVWGRGGRSAWGRNAPFLFVLNAKCWKLDWFKNPIRICFVYVCQV